MLRKRRQAEQGQSKNNQPPGVKPLTDSLAALVPAEVLAIHAWLMSEQTKEVLSKAGEVTTTFHNPTAVWIIFVLLLFASVGFYLAGLMKTPRKCNRFEWAGVLIPPAAFFLWTLVQRPSAWDAVSWLAEPLRPFEVFIIPVGVLILGAAAQRLGVKLDKKPKES
jgi:hypothetical protein